MTIDTLRADHLSLFGYQFRTSPFLDSLAAQGVNFARAYAQVPTTAPSHASLFTSLYPVQHGVRSNFRKLDSSFLTLAEAFSAAGYQTAAFVSTNAHFKTGNIAQGFQVYDQQPGVRQRSKEERRAGKKLNKKRYRVAEETIDAALEWLAGRDSSRKLFLWVHVYDPHGRLRPPKKERAEIERQYREIGRPKFKRFLKPGHGKLGKDHYRGQIRKYDAETLYADNQLRRLFEALDNPQSNDLWVVTSDHGEALHSHGRHGHSKQVYNTLLHVPLIFYSTTGELTPAVIDDVVVEHVDLVPTLAEWMGFDFSGQRDEIRGESLVPLILGENMTRRKTYALSQTGSGPLKISLQSLDFKFILNAGSNDEFYDLTSDPFEHKNLADQSSGQVQFETMKQALVQKIEALSTGALGEVVSEEARERLRALGYLH